MDYSDKLTIQLTIGSKIYPIEIERKQEQIYRRAGNLINERLHRYINTFPNQEKEDYMAMTLIEIAVGLMTESNEDDKIKEMINKIDQTLKLERD